jgi:hypothetical protein
MVYKCLVAPEHDICNELQEAIDSTLDKAESIYGSDILNQVGVIDLQYYEKGRNAAVALVGVTRKTREQISLIQFSMELVKKNIKQMIKEIVPHELSHIICMSNGFDYGHGAIWNDMCRTLGGTGDARHSMRTTDGRLKRFYEALNPAGKSVWLTMKQYKMACAASYPVMDVEGNRFLLTKASLTGKMIRV